MELLYFVVDKDQQVSERLLEYLYSHPSLGDTVGKKSRTGSVVQYLARLRCGRNMGRREVGRRAGCQSGQSRERPRRATSNGESGYSVMSFKEDMIT